MRGEEAYKKKSKVRLPYTGPDESMNPDLEIPSRIHDPSLKPVQPLYVDSWASLHVNMSDITLTDPPGSMRPRLVATLPTQMKLLASPSTSSSSSSSVRSLLLVTLQNREVTAQCTTHYIIT